MNELTATGYMDNQRGTDGSPLRFPYEQLLPKARCNVTTVVRQDGYPAIKAHGASTSGLVTSSAHW
jgi:hypothetical protein